MLGRKYPDGEIGYRFEREKEPSLDPVNRSASLRV